MANIFPMDDISGVFGNVNFGTRRPEYNPTAMQQGMQGLKGLAGNRDLALALLANSGWQPGKRSFGEVLGTSLMQADQMKSQRDEDAFKRQYMQAQMQQMLGNQQKSLFGSISPDKFTPESIKKFEQTGKYSDLVQAPIQRENIDSAQIRNYQFRQSLKTPQEQQLFDDIMRQNYDVVESGGVQNVVRKGPQPTVNPLNTLQNEVAAAAAKKGAEAEASAVGTGTGQLFVDIQKKGANAKSVMASLDLADPLIDAATGSLSGAVADKFAATFGYAPDGAKAIASLKVLQTGLMLNMPRMEGPQSDADRALYEQAAGSLGDPNVPRDIKKAAVQTIRSLQQKYIDRASQPFLFQRPGAAPSNNDPLGLR